ncbi:hypothetical protein [Nitrosopumilus sp.]|uniref:hypothetical protein n=1 Tax=Nitrosopumilus sp. TaxID=2024843 RepID=UPI00247D52C2|nr:hypothetical protein [Nitrosopumilus sp.]MCV0430745.1 hypothetical protein [Nitrosopumilus sp.]
MKIIWIISLLIGFFILVPQIHAETITQNLEGGMDIQIQYPEEIVVGRDGNISILIKNNGWENKEDISFEFSLSGIPGLILDPSDGVSLDKLTQGGSYGENINLQIPDNTNTGIYFLNLKYSHILVANNETPQPRFFHDVAIPITIKNNPSVTIHTKIPESIFSNAEFPIEVELFSKDIDIQNVRLRIIPPKDIEFRGETLHSFSKIEKNTHVAITSRIITPINEVNTEYKIPFQIIVTYTDDVEQEKEDSQTVSVVLRPRTFMELTTDGGIWIGNFFIAPYVSLGTIIGIPAGAIISLLIRKKTSSVKRTKKKKP